MPALESKLDAVVSAMRDEVRALIAEKGDTVLGEVTVEQAYGGMRGLKCLVTETSAVDPQEGIRYRGLAIPQLREQLPKAEGGEEPLPEGVFWLLLTGEVPTAAEVAEITAAWRSHEPLPQYARDVLEALPPDTHPMTQLSMGILALQRESIFAAQYRDGMAKTEYWKPALADALVLIGRLPLLAAYIYRRVYKSGEHIEPAEGLDWAGNLAHMMGIEAQGFKELLRLYLSILADHEGGNVSAHATHLVGSTLSDPYLSLSSGINGLAGPLHGLASQEVMRWIVGVKEKLGGGVPTSEQLSEFIWETLNSGQVVPGYGHGVLRATDPRYMAQQAFANKHLPDDENFRIVRMLYEIVPDILREQGKAKNPWPNVDAHTGCVFVHYGLVEYDFYTVLFGVSRAIGVLASYVWDRALLLPLERPKSVTTPWIRANA